MEEKTARVHGCRISLLFVLGSCAALVHPASGAGINYEEAPIRYSASRDETAVTRLQSRIDRGEAAFEFEDLVDCAYQVVSAHFALGQNFVDLAVEPAVILGA